MSDHEVEMSVAVLNITYVIRGFDAIRDLKLWLDEHASEVQEARVLLPPAGPPVGAVG